MATSAAKVIAACLVLSVSMQMCCGSAIPIWELLTRNEKMSHLYTTFAQLVSVHCKATAATATVPVNECKHSLLSYGYEKLQTFAEAQLDALDPYQRGANELIWSSIMRDHPSSTLITTRKPLLPTPPASSIIILTHQKPAKEAGSSAAAATAHPAQRFEQNPIFNGEDKHKYAMNMDVAYGYPEQSQQQPGPVVEAQQSQSQSPPKTYLTGPLVFRVRPDGTPVEEDRHKPLPRDDDLEAFQPATVSSGGKHRRIATISALKERAMGVQQYLQPPFQQSERIRRHYAGQIKPANSQPASRGYFYGRGQA